MSKAGLAGIERIGRDNVRTPGGYWYLDVNSLFTDTKQYIGMMKSVLASVILSL
jgi:hypothetical protein